MKYPASGKSHENKSLKNLIVLNSSGSSSLKNIETPPLVRVYIACHVELKPNKSKQNNRTTAVKKMKKSIITSEY